MVKAVIFDMYETLITLWYVNPYMGKQLSSDAGIPEKKFREIWDPSENDRSIGKKNFEDVLEEILRVNGRYNPELFNELVGRRKESKRRSFDYIHEGVIPMLEGLKAAGLKIGLITNCFSEEREVIKESVLYQYFDVVCMSCELGIVKPDERIFYYCLDKLGLAPEECIYCGDGGSNELVVARSLNMKPVQALWYLKEDSGQPVGRFPEFIGAQTPEEIVRMALKAD